MNWASMKAAFKLGVKAAQDGKPLDANPYPPESAQFESWADGWRMYNVPAKDKGPQK